LRTADFGQRTFDVIFNSYVLEHVPGAQQVLENFNRWVKPGGLIIIQIPDPYSAYGFTSRMTPHWIHVLVYRLILGQKNAGKPGYAPYPVAYDKVVSREGIRAFCGENGLVLAAEYGMRIGLNNNSLRHKLVEAYKKMLQVLSLGRLSSDYSDIIFIIRKPALPARADLQVSAALPA
jgi:2-polyprenyl-3-methyl-5-hydroxy-6-metoxy-1,4-benzoquinol methylase